MTQYLDVPINKIQRERARREKAEAKRRKRAARRWARRREARIDERPGFNRAFAPVIAN